MKFYTVWPELGTLCYRTRDLKNAVLAPLDPESTAGLSGAARGLVYQLELGLGTTSAWVARDQVRALTGDDRRALRRLGVRVGRRVVYLAAGVKPLRVRRRLALCAAFWGPKVAGFAPAPAAVSMLAADEAEAALYEAIGFPVAGPLAIRADVLERVDGELRRLAGRGRFRPSARVVGLVACTRERAAEVVAALGYRPVGDGSFTVAPRRRRRRRPELARAV